MQHVFCLHKHFLNVQLLHGNNTFIKSGTINLVFFNSLPVSANVSWETTNQYGNYVLLKKSYVANITCRTEGNPAPVTYLQMFQPFMQEWQNASVEDIVLTKKEDVIFSSFLYNINNMTSVTMRCVSSNGVDQPAYSADINVYYFRK